MVNHKINEREIPHEPELYKVGIIRERAEKIISFGAATFPHQLVRILVLEQAYRAVTILTNHPYHRGERALDKPRTACYG